MAMKASKTVAAAPKKAMKSRKVAMRAMKAAKPAATAEAMKAMKCNKAAKTAMPAASPNLKTATQTRLSRAALPKSLTAMKTMKDAAKVMVLIAWLVAANEMVDMADEVGRHGLRWWAGYGGMV